MAHLLVENFFNTRQFTSHTVNSSTVTSDFTVDRIANARRHSRNYWTPDGSNAALHVGVVCDRVRSADMLCIDRNSNLAGEAVRLWASSESDFATYDEYTFTVPSKTYTGNYASDKHPVRADDGAIVYRFPETAGRYWRFTVDAMGAGERPRIGGLWLGKSWTPAITPLPWDDEPKWLSVPEARRGMPSGYVDRGRQGSINIMLRDETEWSQARWHIHSLFWSGYSMWYVPELEYAERSWLSYAPAGSYGAAQRAGRRGRDLAVQMLELQPTRL
mgnify:CR=1 FL=1|tara:strand:+ start:129 stop:950 length:822 start_codon:yes stop_codon:yes gene_type:complete